MNCSLGNTSIIAVAATKRIDIIAAAATPKSVSELIPNAAISSCGFNEADLAKLLNMVVLLAAWHGKTKFPHRD
ncbi:hypothetical protein PanWU01x14_333500 [Parasponia andersonii]|uniref:Uncharacterized protein n=1 Tax=Parasponia andersonii TaxID=3476 RepID=A0A2P5AGY1_PARAD|nr:hypothetical protein PanWU01x14_333500 [Parasponia andersonii]